VAQNFSIDLRKVTFGGFSFKDPMQLIIGNFANDNLKMKWGKYE